MPIARADIPRLLARFKTLRTDKAPVEADWDEIERFIMPITGKTARSADAKPALKTDFEVWDLTAPLACEHLASSLHGNVTSPVGRWVDFEWQDTALEQDEESRKYREQLAELVWSELQASDFNMEIASAYHELAGLGNMALLVEAAKPDVWDGVDFTAVPVREVFFEEDSKGGVLRFYRLLRWTPVQVFDKFGEKGTPEWIRVLAAAPDGGTRRLEIVFCIFRRDDVKLETDGVLVPEARPFGAVYFPLEKAERLGEEEGGYYEMPVVIVPWGRVPGCPWGFGRGNLALRSTKWLNAFKESSREAAARAANPPTVGTERGVLSPPDRDPGGHTVVSSTDDLKELPSTARFDVSAEVLRDERAEIRRAFHEDDLQLKESPQMTAAEVQARLDLMDRVLGSPHGRITGGLAAVVKITLGLLARAKRLPPVPDLVRQKKAELKMKFRGRLARAQLMDEVVGIEREAAFVASLLKMGFDEARFHFDVGQAIREHAKRVGAPAATLRSLQKVKELEDRARAAATRQVDATAAKTEGEAARAAAQAAAAGAAPAGGLPLGIAPQPALAPSGGIVA